MLLIPLGETKASFRGGKFKIATRLRPGISQITPIPYLYSRLGRINVSIYHIVTSRTDDIQLLRSSIPNFPNEISMKKRLWLKNRWSSDTWRLLYAAAISSLSVDPRRTEGLSRLKSPISSFFFSL